MVVGNASSTEGSGWWKHQFSGDGSPHIDPALAAGYLEVVNAVSSVFSEDAQALTPAQAHAILSPTANDARARARAELLLAWLQFASGAVAWDATVSLGGNQSIAFLDLMFDAEEVILNPAATNAELKDIELMLAKVRHGG